ncbi:MAG: hydroxymethylbilane synthase [Planctomycetaceae bacterium]
MPAPPPLRVGTRGSQLAVTQTGWAVERLRAHRLDVEVQTITTRGDVRHDVPVAGLGQDGVFVRELEQALLDGRIDVAVHSLKDLPTAETPGLVIASVPERELPFDVVVGRPGTTLAGLPAGSIVGTSSIRRVTQVRALRDDLVVRPLRGNVDTRLRRLEAGDYDCLILAGAGLRRLGLANRITEVLEPDAFWPAIAQGALALQTRADDADTRRAVAVLDHPATHDAVRAERACLAVLAGGCLAPIGGWARLDADGRLRLGACVLEQAGDRVRRILAEDVMTPSQEVSTSSGPVELGGRVAESLVGKGAAEMLARVRAGAVAG